MIFLEIKHNVLISNSCSQMKHVYDAPALGSSSSPIFVHGPMIFRTNIDGLVIEKYWRRFPQNIRYPASRISFHPPRQECRAGIFSSGVIEHSCLDDLSREIEEHCSCRVNIPAITTEKKLPNKPHGMNTLKAVKKNFSRLIVTNLSSRPLEAKSNCFGINFLENAWELINLRSQLESVRKVN